MRLRVSQTAQRIHSLALRAYIFVPFRPKVSAKTAGVLRKSYFFFFKTSKPFFVSETTLSSGTLANGVPFLLLGSLAK